MIKTLFSKIAWSRTQTDKNTGNRQILTLHGTVICELPEPIRTDEAEAIYTERVIEQRANELLIRHSVALFERLEHLEQQLKDLKTGKLSIFNFDVNKEHQETLKVLLRASNLD